MVSLRKLCRCSLGWMAASFLLCGFAEATAIYSNTISIAAGDPTQLGRLSRGGIPQDWSGGEDFPGVLNTTTSYHYFTVDLDLDALESGYTDYGGFLQVSFDSTFSTTFLSAYEDTYAPDPVAPNRGLDTNWLGDPGFSGNFFGTDPVFFQVIVPSTHHLILVLNESVTNGGLGQPGTVLVEAFTDTEFTDLTPRSSSVPEPGTWALLMCGMVLLAVRRYRPTA